MAIRQIHRMHAEKFGGRMIQRERGEPSGAQIVGHDEGRLVDDALSRDGRGAQRIAIVGAQVAGDLDADLGIAAERPPAGA
jgi:hypothetical protein